MINPSLLSRVHGFDRTRYDHGKLETPSDAFPDSKHKTREEKYNVQQ